MNPRIALIPLLLVAYSIPAHAGNPDLDGGFGFPGARNFGLDERPANASCIAPDRPDTTLSLSSQQVFANLSFAGLKPISMSQPPGDPSRWLFAGREGRILSFANDDAVTTSQLVLDITDRIEFHIGPHPSAMYGITSFALHPQFPTTPYIYVAYNARVGTELWSIVARFSSADGGQTFDSSSEQIVLSLVQPPPHHHLNEVLFGPDGFLYIALGDSQQPLNAQDLSVLPGSILRIDIDQGLPYTIPPDNPLVGTGAREEIYAWGLRNPWRVSFDSETGTLWVGDVGNNLWEEINRIAAGGNYGWPIMEGPECRTDPKCNTAGLTPPELGIQHDTANVIIGGYVYRGSEIPTLQGTYVFGDATYAQVRALFYDQQGQPFWDVIGQTVTYGPTGFAQSLDGEIYFFRHGIEKVYKLVNTAPPGGSTFPGLLSETGCVDPLDPSVPASGLIPFTVNAALWSDGADKDRWMALPDGQTIDISPDGDFEFPIGTVLMKTFSFDTVPVETRLFVRHDDGGWAGYSYEWNQDLTDAVLLPAGKVVQVTPEITWTFPSREQCLQCHTDIAGSSLGPEIVQLNGPFLYPSNPIPANQLATLEHIGMFSNGLPDQPASLPALVSPTANGAPDERKARSYLHANCSGCHRPQGPTPATADFRFSTPVEGMNVCNALPGSGDLGVLGATLLSPGNPGNSIISLRMHALDINRMPPLGTAIVDTLGTAVVDAWIAQTDVCAIYPDTDADSVRDNVDNCTVLSNPDQRDTDGDGIGNRCDPDVAVPNDCSVNFLDLDVYKNNFFQSGDLDTDNNGDGQTNFLDLDIIKSFFFAPPGPSAAGCN